MKDVLESAQAYPVREIKHTCPDCHGQGQVNVDRNTLIEYLASKDNKVYDNEFELMQAFPEITKHWEETQHKIKLYNTPFKMEASVGKLVCPTCGGVGNWIERR